jgi:modulator of FtsH protease
LSAYDVEAWSDLFVASAGAAAALAGLVFVAVSINIQSILAYEGLPERALETVATLLLVVLVSIICLIPGQSDAALGIELLVTSVVFTAFIAKLSHQKVPPGAEPRRWLISRLAVRAIAAVPLLVGAISIIGGSGGGLYWVVAGILGAILGGVANAWVLLVEILR